MSSATGGAIGQQGFEFRADVEDFERFVEQGHRYVVALEQLIDDVRLRRSITASAIGYDVGPPDTSSRWLEELVSEAAINNAFVAGIGDSLQDLTALADSVPGGQPPAFGALVTGGVSVDGTDLALEDDRALLAQLRSWPLLTAGVSAEAVHGLTVDAKTHHAALALLDVGVHPLALSQATPRRVVAVLDRYEAEDQDQLGVDHLAALLGDGYGANLHRRIMAGELAPPDGSVRDAVVDAMVAGLAPSELGLATEYFPAFYRREVELRSDIADAEARRDIADGSWWSWRDDDPDEVAKIDAELSGLREERAALALANGSGENGAVGYFTAVAATSDVTAGSSWEGQLYGAHFNGFHQTKVSGGWLGGDEGRLKDPDGNSVELEHIGLRLAVDPQASVAFFNRIGPERAADLPTFVAGNDLGNPVFEAFSRGLAGATTATSVTGESLLTFTGAQLLEQPRRATGNGVIWYSPALLFTVGRFDPTFLADASLALLRAADRGDERAVNTFDGIRTSTTGQHVTTVVFRGGEDPRNILLDRASESLEAIEQLIASLAGLPGDTVGESIPAAGALDPLLRPTVPFRPAGARWEPQHWLDRIVPGVVLADEDHPAINGGGQPTLSSSYPIATFLAAAGDNDGLTRTILHAVATAAAGSGTDRVVVQDVGTASGLDLLLARNASLLIAPTDLAALGIVGSTLNVDTGLPIRADEWRTVFGEVLRLGRGQALAAGLDQLLGRAVGASVGLDGWFRSELAAPFAQVAGRVRDEAALALTTYSADLDQLARDRNRAANLVASLVMSGIGFLPMLGPVAAAGSASWSWFFDGYPTDNELQARIAQADVSEWQRSETWETMIAEHHLRRITGGADPSAMGSPSPGVPGPSELELVVPGVGLATVAIRRQTIGDTLTYRWQHPESGEWQRIPSPSSSEFEELFGPVPPGVGTSMWLNIVESRDLIDDYQRESTEGPRLDDWLGPRRS